MTDQEKSYREGVEAVLVQLTKLTGLFEKRLAQMQAQIQATSARVALLESESKKTVPMP